jgi:hypothetical protein
MALTIGSIVLASVYFVVAWITKKTSVGFDRKERVLWTAIPIALALLGINKLFEGALTNVGRMIANQRCSVGNAHLWEYPGSRLASGCALGDHAFNQQNAARPCPRRWR